ncbi:MAG: C-terminal binding protein [Kordiimonadaceae bacterium]|jgi:D-3-phosphoglycerate dehydrogenase / 2-oxoglutarate reductase|nr:C-terminal binding protein [Kordiimonadaceae bacterium]MBT6330185.1 C-terminal binding protein [Kordiimonadaceae bacterium]
MSKKLIVTDYNFPSLIHEEAAATAENAAFLAANTKTADDVLDVIADADVALVQFAPVGAREIATLRPGATLIRYGVGYDNIDIAAAKEQNVQVAYVPDYCAAEVADHTTALLLSAVRKVVSLDTTTRDGQWSPVAQAAPILSLNETTIGFLGYGRIGSLVKSRLEPFGCRFIVADPYISDEFAETNGFKKVSTAELATLADVVTLHAPLTSDTRHVVGPDFLKAMHSHAIIVNSSRGELIDTQALAASLTAEQIGGAALDVFETEPLEMDHPLRSAPNLLISPHAAWYSSSSIDRLQRLAAEEVGRALRGEPLRCPVPGF